MAKSHYHILRDQMGASPSLERWGFAVEEFSCFVPPKNRYIHTHDFVEMVFVREGQGIHRLESGSRPLKPGTLAIIHQHQAHGFESHTPHLHLINLYFDLARINLPVPPAPLDDVLPLILPLHPPFGRRRQQIVHLQFSEPEALAHLFLLLRDEMAADEKSFGGVANGLAFFLSLACRQYLRERKSTISRRRHMHTNAIERVERLCHHLDIHFTENASLPLLAKMAGLQPHYLCRLFKAHTGESLFTYILHRRLEKCLLLLRQSQQKVLDIALSCGFNNLPHFNRIFKREMKVSPLAYRKQFLV